MSQDNPKNPAPKPNTPDEPKPPIPADDEDGQPSGTGGNDQVEDEGGGE